MEASEEARPFGASWDMLEAMLRERVGESSLYGNKLVGRACQEAALAPFETDLLNLVQLRNILKHNEHVPLAEPTLAATELVQTVLNLLNLRALDIAARPVFVVDERVGLDAVTSAMETNVYTAVPVIRDRRIIGVFSEATAVRLLAQTSHARTNGSQVVGDIVEHLDHPDRSDRYAHYRCTTADAAASEVFDWFSDSTANGIRLNAVFLTSTGTAEDLPIGVVTAWDLRRLSHRSAR